MYSVLCSKLDFAIDEIIDKIKKHINKEAKVVILPWAFPIELDKEKFNEEYFKKGEKRYNRYLNAIQKLEIMEEKFEVLNCYDMLKEEIEYKIKTSDILILPGGNPEMFYKKIKELEIENILKEYKGLIIGESAGAVLHFHKYFLTEENNYYGYFAYYNGLGLLKDDFEIDVHTIDSEEYLQKLEKISKNDKKLIYAMSDNGAILVNRINNKIEVLSDTKIIKC